MTNYKRITIEETGLVMNKDLYEYIKHYKTPEKGNLSTKEYNYYLQILERKAIEDLKETKLIRWNNVKEWTANKNNIEIKFKFCNKSLNLEFDYSLINSLEKYCYNKGKVIEKQSFYDSKLALYIFYLISFIICYLLLNNMN